MEKTKTKTITIPTTGSDLMQKQHGQTKMIRKKNETEITKKEKSKQ